MAYGQLVAPVATHSGTNFQTREDEEFAQQHDEHPLDVVSTQSTGDTSSQKQAHEPLHQMHTREEQFDDPPPPYEELASSAVEITPVEFSAHNSPQLVVSPHDNNIPIPPRSPRRLSGSNLPEVSHAQSENLPEVRHPPDENLPQVSPALTERSLQSTSRLNSRDPSLIPPPLQPRTSSLAGKTVPSVSSPSSQGSSTPRVFSSAKAREAGFEITPDRSNSSGSLPSLKLIETAEKLEHTREPGKLTAYLIPYPKPRIKGAKPEDIPDRFLVYTPPAPPLSKPADGEKEPHWHKTQRKWQEDVRKATMSNASAATWKGMKARTTKLIGKSVSMTKTSNLEFLDRVSEGAITSTAEAIPEDAISPDQTKTGPVELAADAGQIVPDPPAPERKSSKCSKAPEKDAKPKPAAIEELTLVFPPSLSLAPEQIRAEFVETLLRTQQKSQRDAFVASSLVPIAAAVDASLILTLGGLTEVSAVWAHSSIRGSITSRRMTKGLKHGEQQEVEELEMRGCTCGHHENDFGSAELLQKKQGKNKKKGISLRLQQSDQLEVLRRYMDVQCLKKDFSMFPHVDEVASDANEAAVLDAIGWQPTERRGKELEIEYEKGRIERMTPAQDMQWQGKEARDDVKRIMKKGAAEWVTFCKNFHKDSKKK